MKRSTFLGLFLGGLAVPATRLIPKEKIPKGVSSTIVIYDHATDKHYKIKRDAFEVIDPSKAEFIPTYINIRPIK